MCVCDILQTWPYLDVKCLLPGTEHVFYHVASEPALSSRTPILQQNVSACCRQQERDLESWAVYVVQQAAPLPPNDSPYRHQLAGLVLGISLIQGK